jgi:hypothetical protein
MVNITQEEQNIQFIIDNFDDVNIDTLIEQYDTPFKKLYNKLEFLQSRNRKIKAVDILWIIKPFISRILEIHSVNVLKKSLLRLGAIRTSSLWKDTWDFEYDKTMYIKLDKNNRNTSLSIKRIVEEQYWNLF